MRAALRRLWPDSLFARSALLLAVVLLATLSLSAWSLRALSLYSGGDQIADLLAGLVVAEQALLRRPPVVASAARSAPVLDLRIASAPPRTAIAARLPFLLRIEARLKQRLGPATQMRLEEGPESRLWVSTAADSRWIGVKVPPFAQQATQLTLVVLMVAGTLLLLAGEAVDAQALRGPRELRLLSQALQEAARARQAAERERALMLAGLSHDLRTPLARLRLALELDPADVALRAGMAQDIDELDAILGQFIEFARGSGGETAQPHDLAELLLDLARSERLDRAQWTLRGFDAPCIRRIRPSALRRAVVNLLRNAVRHGRPPFRLELEAGEEQVVLRVVDSGPGIGDADAAVLVQPFVRGDAARGGAGSGLGLAIVAQVAREHGGTLRLRSAPGAGFVAELELCAPC